MDKKTELTKLKHSRQNKCTSILENTETNHTTVPVLFSDVLNGKTHTRAPLHNKKTTSQLQAASPQHWKSFDPKSTVAHRTVARPRPLIASHFGSQRPQLMRGQSQRGVMGT